MGYMEKPPILQGSEQQQIKAIRDYLYRMAGSLETVIGAVGSGSEAKISILKDGRQAVSTSGGSEAQTIEAMRRNAQELQALIIKHARELGTEIVTGDSEVKQYADHKEEIYNRTYLAISDFGNFQDNLSSLIETTAGQVVESYGYQSLISANQANITTLQQYFTTIDGEIKRGIVLDPSTNTYVTGIAISQNLEFYAECGPSDPNHPDGDSYTYYYLTEGQTFGLYTSTGWQFWIDGYKKGWFSSTDGMLHVSNIVVENTLQISDAWQIKASGDALEFIHLGE